MCRIKYLPNTSLHDIMLQENYTSYSKLCIFVSLSSSQYYLVIMPTIVRVDYMLVQCPVLYPFPPMVQKYDFEPHSLALF